MLPFISKLLFQIQTWCLKCSFEPMTSIMWPMQSEFLVPGQFLMDRWQLTKKRRQPQLAPWWGVIAMAQRLKRSKEKVISSPPPDSSATAVLKQMDKALWEKIVL